MLKSRQTQRNCFKAYTQDNAIMPCYKTVNPMESVRSRYFDESGHHMQEIKLTSLQQSWANNALIIINKNIQDDCRHKQNNCKINIHSRQNIHQMNKKTRQIRTKRAASSIGIYNIQNDQRFIPERNFSSLKNFNDHKIDTEININVQSVKSFHKLTNEKPIKLKQANPKHENKTNCNQQQNQVNLRAKVVQNTRKLYKSAFQTQRDSNNKKIVKSQSSGYILHKFRSSLKQKNIQDNLHVMATLIKRKIKNLDKKDVVLYIVTLMKKCNKN